jgi:catabolite repression HPr-like protein
MIAPKWEEIFMFSQKISSMRSHDIGDLIPHIVQTACAYKSVITFEVNNRRVNAKSIMGMMSLEAPAGETVEVTVEGLDEQTAMKEIEAFLCNGRVSVCVV